MEDDKTETWVMVGRVLEGEWAIWSARREFRRRALPGGKAPAATRIDIREEGRAISLPVLTGRGVADNENK